MKRILLLLGLTLITLSCNKDDETPVPGNFQTPLPEATQTGKGTFACYVDGNAYITKKMKSLFIISTCKVIILLE